MSKYCPKCNKTYKKEYSKFCPKCMEELEIIYSNQSRLDGYNKKLKDYLKELEKLNKDIYENQKLLDDSYDEDEKREYKFKIMKFNEKKGSLETKIDKTQKSIKKEENSFKQEKKELKRKEILYMKLYTELSDIMIENLCDYFMIKMSSRDKAINRLVDKYSENAINDAINIIEDEIEEEMERKRQYDALMKTLDKKDVQLLCAEFSISNPSKPKIVNHLIDNYSPDEIEILKLDVYRKEQQRKKEQKRQKRFNELSSNLNDESIRFISKKLSLRNTYRDDVIDYLIDNCSKKEIDNLLNELKNVEKFYKIKSTLKKDHSLDNLPGNLKKSALSWYNKGKNGDADFADYYNDINMILKSQLSCLKDKLNVRLAKLIVQFEFNSDLKTVSSYSGLYASTIEGYYKQGRNGDLAYKNFYDNVSKLRTDLGKFDSTCKPKKDKHSLPKDVMKSIVSEMRNGSSRAEAGKKFGIRVFEINKSYNLGKKSYSPDTVKFYNQIKSIEMENRNNSPNKVKVQPTKIIPRARERKDSEKRKDEENMKKVINLMNRGYSRNEAANELGIPVGLIVMWNRQGANGEGKAAINFNEQLTRIEKSR